MLLIVDNYDSFVHNLARYCTLAGFTAQKIVRNDAITIDDIHTLNPAAIVLSPGPNTPRDAGISIDIIKKFGAHIPIFGVCLGHQAIGEAYDYKSVNAVHPLHGQASPITHDGCGLFHGIPTPVAVGRYHSLVIDPTYKGDLMVTASSEYGEIMAVKHEVHPVYGVQFHPESILTDHGLKIIENFKHIVENFGEYEGCRAKK